MRPHRGAFVIGPIYRPTPPETCICGASYTTEWAHRQTGWHKRYEANFRRGQRIVALRYAMEARYANERTPTRRQLRKALGYTKEVA